MSEPRAYVGNAADAEQVKNARRLEKDQDEVARADMLVLLGLPEGRRFLWRLLEFCHWRTAIQPGAMAEFYEGERNVGLWAFAQIEETQPEALIKMMLEAKSEKDRKILAAQSQRSRRKERENTHAPDEFDEGAES